MAKSDVYQKEEAVAFRLSSKVDKPIRNSWTFLQ